MVQSRMPGMAVRSENVSVGWLSWFGHFGKWHLLSGERVHVLGILYAQYISSAASRCDGVWASTPGIAVLSGGVSVVLGAG